MLEGLSRLADYFDVGCVHSVTTRGPTGHRGEKMCAEQMHMVERKLVFPAAIGKLRAEVKLP